MIGVVSATSACMNTNWAEQWIARISRIVASSVSPAFDTNAATTRESALSA